jgi:hypothetical protein
MSGRACNLPIQLLLSLVSAVTLRSTSRRTRYPLLLSHLALWVPFCNLLRLSGLRWKYSNPPPPEVCVVYCVVYSQDTNVTENITPAYSSTLTCVSFATETYLHSHSHAVGNIVLSQYCDPLNLAIHYHPPSRFMVQEASLNSLRKKSSSSLWSTSLDFRTRLSMLLVAILPNLAMAYL